MSRLMANLPAKKQLNNEMIACQVFTEACAKNLPQTCRRFRWTNFRNTGLSGVLRFFPAGCRRQKRQVN